MRDHQGITIGKFNGLWSRGGSIETVPSDHLSDGLNFECLEQGVKTRGGFDSLLTFNSVKRLYVYKIYGQADRFLILDSGGSIWDSTNLITPILTIASMTDFAFQNINGYAYISPHNGTVGLVGEKLYVYTGSGVARAAAGAAPIGSSLAAVNSAVSGHVEAGFHIFAVAYETSTGFITAPGPTVFATLTANGDLSVDLSGIPTGPSYISARWILATKIITDYNGNQEGYEFFFVPGGRIPNNTATTLTVSFFDGDLFDSASYLFDLFSEIPAGNHLSIYHGRLCLGGENANPSVERISENGQPEAINQVSGLLQIDTANASSAITNAQEYRDILYIAKKSRWYATNDNNGDPATWQTIPLDQGLGADVHSIATVLDTGGINVDKVLVANVSGFWIFKGFFVHQELSWKIDDLWARINKLYFNTVQVALDPNKARAYIAVPLDSATSPSHIIMMDFENVSTDDKWYAEVRWHLWTIGNNRVPTSIAVRTNSANQLTELVVGSSVGNVYKQNDDALNDFSNLIPTPFIQTCPIPVQDEFEGNVLHFGGVRLRVHGVGTLKGTLYSYDAVTSEDLADYTLSSVPGVEKTLVSFFQCEKAYLKLYVSSISHWFKVNKIRFFVNELWDDQPG